MYVTCVQHKHLLKPHLQPQHRPGVHLTGQISWKMAVSAMDVKAVLDSLYLCIAEYRKLNQVVTAVQKDERFYKEDMPV